MSESRNGKLIDQAIRNISEAINWERTPEGHAFWFGVVDKLVREARCAEQRHVRQSSLPGRAA